MAVGRTFTSAEAAKYLGVTDESIKSAARKGNLKGYRDRLHLGGPWRFSKEDLDAYAESRKQRVK